MGIKRFQRVTTENNQKEFLEQSLGFFLQKSPEQISEGDNIINISYTENFKSYFWINF